MSSGKKICCSLSELLNAEEVAEGGKDKAQ